jgi:hypothetical protein
MRTVAAPLRSSLHRQSVTRCRRAVVDGCDESAQYVGSTRVHPYAPASRSQPAINMRTLLIIVAGFLTLGISLFVGSRIGGTNAMVAAAKLFIPVWILVAGVNMWIGVARAGYSVAEEFPIFVGIFAVPAAAALFVWWKYS